jgi:8-oxo-dGTP diphosphatase
MKQVATGLLFDSHGRLLIYLRDNKPTIPFPNRWDLFGGHVEAGEEPEQALVREVEEELGLTLEGYAFFRSYYCLTGDAGPNVKFVYWARIKEEWQDLTLHEGQRHLGIDINRRGDFEFANILANIIEDFAQSPELAQATTGRH